MLNELKVRGVREKKLPSKKGVLYSDGLLTLLEVSMRMLVLAMICAVAVVQAEEAVVAKKKLEEKAVVATTEAEDEVAVLAAEDEQEELDLETKENQAQ